MDYSDLSYRKTYIPRNCAWKRHFKGVIVILSLSMRRSKWKYYFRLMDLRFGCLVAKNKYRGDFAWKRHVMRGFRDCACAETPKILLPVPKRISVFRVPKTWIWGNFAWKRHAKGVLFLLVLEKNNTATSGFKMNHKFGFIVPQNLHTGSGDFACKRHYKAFLTF